MASKNHLFLSINLNFNVSFSQQNVSNILTRRRKVKLDGKTSAQISQTFGSSGHISGRMPDAQKKKQSMRRRFKSFKSTSQSAHVTETTKPDAQVSKPIKQLDSTSNAVLVNPNSSVAVREKAILEIDTIAKESTVELPLAKITHDGDADIPPESENDEPKVDLGIMESADSDSLVPDSSVILAAMRETMRQTDAVMPSQTFVVTTKKRKRDDTKCKQESYAKDFCAESKPKYVSPSNTTCVECNKTFANPEGNDIQVCEDCTSRRCKTRSASIRGRERENKPRKVRNMQGKLKQQVSSVDNIVQTCGDEKPIITESTKEDSPSKALISDEICSVKSKKPAIEMRKNVNAGKIKAAKKERNVRNLRNNEVSKNSERLETYESHKNQTDENVEESGVVAAIDGSTENTDALEIENGPKICQTPKVDVINRKEKNIESNLKSISTKAMDVCQNVKDSKSAAEVDKDDAEPKIISCKVCHGLSIRPVCDSCASIARKNKICAFCKQTLAPRSNTLPICETCKVGQYLIKTETSAQSSSLPKREFSEWILCKVCKRTNHKVVCSSCVVMSQKHKICARCNIRWEDPKGTGMPVCPSCEKVWYPSVTKDNEDVDKCNATCVEKKLSEPVGIYSSNEISVHVNNEENIPTATVCKSPDEITTTSATTVPPTSLSTSIQVSKSNTAVPVTSKRLTVSSNLKKNSSLPSAIVSTSSTSTIVTGNIPSVSTVSTTMVSESVIKKRPKNLSKSNGVLLVCKGMRFQII